jgi:hypothetical protein
VLYSTAVRSEIEDRAAQNKPSVMGNVRRRHSKVGVYENIASLGITLPEVTPQVAAFVTFVRSGKQVFLSGHIAMKNGNPGPVNLVGTSPPSRGKTPHGALRPI